MGLEVHVKLERHVLLGLAAHPGRVTEALGEAADPEGIRYALRLLCSSPAWAVPNDSLLQMARERIRSAWPRPGPARRAALLTLLVARGELRRHAPIPFDAQTLAELA